MIEPKHAVNSSTQMHTPAAKESNQSIEPMSRSSRNLKSQIAPSLSGINILQLREAAQPKVATTTKCALPITAAVEPSNIGTVLQSAEKFIPAKFKHMTVNQQ